MKPPLTICIESSQIQYLITWFDNHVTTHVITILSLDYYDDPTVLPTDVVTNPHMSTDRLSVPVSQQFPTDSSARADLRSEDWTE